MSEESRVVRRPDDWDEPTVIPDIDRTIERIVVPFDGTSDGETALAWAEVVAGISGAEIVVVVPYEPPITVRRRGILLVEEARAEMEEDARILAEEAVTLLVERGGRARGIIVKGDPVHAILETVEAEHAQLLVMARRDQTSWGSRFLGSISSRVAHESEIPVLLV